MKGTLLRYNKVHNDSLAHLAAELKKDFDVCWADLPHQGSIDLLPYEVVSKYLDSLLPLDFIVIGDVFWMTGQNICKWAKQAKVRSLFLQHGQWIYVRNKKRLPYYPDMTLFFGDNVYEMCKKWPYAQESRCFVTGSPRYDDARPAEGSYLYFTPPIIEEIVHGKHSGVVCKESMRMLTALKGIDRELPIIIQPHYREARTEWIQSLFPAAQFADPTLNPLKFVKGASKVIAARHSTSVLDAIAHRKPVLLTNVIDSGREFFPRGYFGNFARESTSKKEFLNNASADSLFNGNDYVQKAKKHVFLGNASTRIVSLMNEV